MRIRTSVSAAGLAVATALVLTGCSSDDGGKADAPKKSARASESAPASDPETVKSGDLQGQWTGTTDGETVTIGVTGKAVVMMAGKSACTGEVADHGQQMLSMKCAAGGGGRTMGTIESADGKTLVVAWDKGKKDTLKKAKLGDLPTDLPSDLKDLKDIKGLDGFEELPATEAKPAS